VWSGALFGSCGLQSQAGEKIVPQHEFIFLLQNQLLPPKPHFPLRKPPLLRNSVSCGDILIGFS